MIAPTAAMSQPYRLPEYVLLFLLVGSMCPTLPRLPLRGQISITVDLNRGISVTRFSPQRVPGSAPASTSSRRVSVWRSPPSPSTIDSMSAVQPRLFTWSRGARAAVFQKDGSGVRPFPSVCSSCASATEETNAPKVNAANGTKN